MKQAVFIIVKNENNQILCVTRPAEKAKYEGDFGLPGGMVEKGETLLDAIWRESFEEGLDITHINPSFIQAIYYEDKGLKVYWFIGKGKFTDGDFLEKGRITQVYKTIEETAASTRGNASAMKLIS